MDSKRQAAVAISSIVKALVTARWCGVSRMATTGSVRAELVGVMIMAEDAFVVGGVGSVSWRKSCSVVRCSWAQLPSTCASRAVSLGRLSACMAFTVSWIHAGVAVGFEVSVWRAR